LFELSQVRALLLIFPNTFEYFFDFYEAVRVRWNPLRMSVRLVVGAAAFIWIFIKLPQEWWIHVAQLDATDTIKTRIFGVPATSSWPDAIAANPSVVVITGLAIVVLVVAAWWLVTRRLPPADHPPTFDADANQPAVGLDLVVAERLRLAEKLFNRELVEKIALVSLVSVIFSRMLPDIDAAPWTIAVGVALVIVVDTMLSEWVTRAGRAQSTTVRHFGALLVANVVILVIGQVLIGFLTGRVLEHAVVFVLLLTLIVTLYDRYRPIHLARFAGEGEGRVAGSVGSVALPSDS
jgi:hypothetical protein